MPNLPEKLLTHFVLSCLLISLCFVISCTKAQMGLSPDLVSHAKEMSVEGRSQFTFNQSFSFGPYKVQDVERSWTETTAWGILGYESFEAKQEYGFVLVCPALPNWRINCATGVKQQVWETMLAKGAGQFTWELSAHDTLVCSLEPQGVKTVWRLLMSRSTKEDSSKGILTNDNTSILVEGTNRLANTSIPLSDTTGFHFKQGKRVIAAVEIINQGRVWFGPGLTLETQNAIAAASSALLLYQDIGRD